MIKFYLTRAALIICCIYAILCLLIGNYVFMTLLLKGKIE
jgi:ABC-type transport system involved in multi-copper enzyme maturation permease subunit